jgi:malate dehydrogenase
MNKISIIGAGRVGETAACIIAQQEMCSEVVLLDIREGAAAGAALDISQSASYFGFDTRVTGGNDPALLKGSELIVSTAGSPRKPGMSRSDVLDINRAVIDTLVDDVLKYAPDSLSLVRQVYWMPRAWPLSWPRRPDCPPRTFMHWSSVATVIPWFR